MIVGIGIDIVEVARLKSSMERHGEFFLKRVFTGKELAAAPTTDSPARAAYFAGRWAAKEAVSKVFRTGIGAQCGLTDMAILPREDGSPTVELSGAAAQTAKRLGIKSLQVSISHEKTYAVAMAIGESN